MSLFINRRLNRIVYIKSALDEVSTYRRPNCSGLPYSGPGFRFSCIGPITRIACLDGPLSQVCQVRMIFLELPAVGHQIAQRIQVVASWEINLQENQNGLYRLLSGLLSKPASMARCHVRRTNDSLGSYQIFVGVS